MAAISLHALQLPQLKPCVHQHAPMKNLMQCRKMRKSVTKVSAIPKRDAYGHDNDGKMVDENMVVLKKRIHDMKMEEESQMETQKAGWMEWEKRYYPSYCSDVFEAVALLQHFLMNSRPALSLGMGLIVLLSLLLPIWMIGVQLIELANKRVGALIRI